MRLQRLVLHVPAPVMATEGQLDCAKDAKWKAHQLTARDFADIIYGAGGGTTFGSGTHRAFHVFQRHPGDTGQSTVGAIEMPSPLQATLWISQVELSWKGETPWTEVWGSAKDRIEAALGIDVPRGRAWHRVVDSAANSRISELPTNPVDVLNPKDFGDNREEEFSDDVPMDFLWPGHLLHVGGLKCWSAPLLLAEFVPTDSAGAKVGAEHIEQVHVSLSNLYILLRRASEADRLRGFEEVSVTRDCLDNFTAIVESVAYAITKQDRFALREVLGKDKRVKLLRGAYPGSLCSMSQIVHTVFEDSRVLNGFLTEHRDKLVWLFRMYDSVRNVYSHRPGPINASTGETGAVPYWVGTNEAQYVAATTFMLAHQIWNRQGMSKLHHFREAAIGAPPVARAKTNVVAREYKDS